MIMCAYLGIIFQRYKQGFEYPKLKFGDQSMFLEDLTKNKHNSLKHNCCVNSSSTKNSNMGSNI